MIVCYFNLNASRAIRDVSLERLELPPQSETRDEAILVMAALVAPHALFIPQFDAESEESERDDGPTVSAEDVRLSPESEAKN